MLRLVFALCILPVGLYNAAAMADQNRDVSGSKDFPTIARYPQAAIVAYVQDQEVNYRLALGILKKVQGRVVPEYKQRLLATLTRITYRIPEGVSGEEVYAFYRKQLLAVRQNELFSCQSRQCGSSNFWANNIFDNRILYGPERNQFYFAALLEPGLSQAQQAFAAVYVITRGNKRLYAHIDVIESEAETGHNLQANPETVLEILRQKGSILLTGTRFSAQDEIEQEGSLTNIAKALAMDVRLRLYIVGHLQEGESLASLSQRSLRRAENVKDVLVQKGIDAVRLTAKGVGPLAPSCDFSNCQQRIELVLNTH